MHPYDSFTITHCDDSWWLIQIVMRRDRTNQDYRFGDDYYNNRNDLIRLESARLPLRHQNEGYLKYLLGTYDLYD